MSSTHVGWDWRAQNRGSRVLGNDAGFAAGCRLPERAFVVKGASPVTRCVFSSIEAVSLVKMDRPGRRIGQRCGNRPERRPRAKTEGRAAAAARLPSPSVLAQCDKSHGDLQPRVMSEVDCPACSLSAVVHGSIYGFDRSRSCRLSPRLHPNTSLRDDACRSTVVPFLCVNGHGFFLATVPPCRTAPIALTPTRSASRWWVQAASRAGAPGGGPPPRGEGPMQPR